MVREAAPLLEIDEQTLLDELQLVHQRHADSEHPFALLETNAVRSKFAGMDQKKITEIMDPAFHAFNRVRKNNLVLYDTVRASLQLLYSLEIPLIAYTDARVINCLFRLNRLEIRQYFRALYSPSHREKYLEVSAANEDFVHLLPADDRKPNPKTLLDICDAYETVPSQALYVGDSLSRDIFMARNAGLRSAWAKYGTLYDKTLWPQLVRVTHWTGEDIAREKELRERAAGTEPDCTLGKFEDIFSCFEFSRVPDRNGREFRGPLDLN